MIKPLKIIEGQDLDVVIEALTDLQLIANP